MLRRYDISRVRLGSQTSFCSISMMPIMNAYQFRTEQLKSAERAAIPVAIITADGSAEEKVAELRAAAFLNQPSKVQMLLDPVARILR